MIVIDGKIIEINREDVEISEIDEAYCQLVKKVLDHGQLIENRTGIDTLAIPNWNFVFHLDKGFPISETKLVNAKNLSSEIQWIHQEQSNEVKWLNDRDNYIWDQWVVDKDGVYRIYEPIENGILDPERMVPLVRKVANPQTGVIEKVPVLNIFGKPKMVRSWDLMQGVDNPRTIKEAIWFGKKYSGSIGEGYGFINKKYHAPQRVEYTLKHNPTDRRMNIALFQYPHLAKAVLPPCVHLSEYTVIKGVLHSAIDQRSADLGPGVSFNIPQYALLTHMFARTNDFEPGTMSWHITNAHIYVNQLEAMEKQLKRYGYMVEYRDIIKKTQDGELQVLYNNLKDTFDMFHRRATILIKEDIRSMKMSDRIDALKLIDKELAAKYEESYERKISFEHMVTRKTPRLELAKHDSIFEYSTDYVPKGDPYLKENPIGNKELVLKNYTPTPFIKMPVAQ